MPGLRILLLLLVLVILGLPGCRRSPTYGPLAEVAGTVTVDGMPLDNGTIAFVTPASGDVQVFEVRGGRFAGRARVGCRQVEFRRYAPSKPDRSDFDLPGPVPFPANTLPAHLGALSTITATVTSAGPNTFAFELRSKGHGD